MKNYIYLLVLLSALSSCERELQLSNSENGLMVLNGLIDANETIAISLVKSASILEDEPINEITDATVSIFKDGIFMEDLVFMASDDTPINKYYGQGNPEPNGNYSIEVTHPTYGLISATTIIPESPAITNVYCQNTSDGLSDVLQLNFQFTLNDSPETDYYFLRLGAPVYRMENNVVGEFYGFNPIEISEQPVAGEVYLNKGFIFSDESFNDSQLEFSGIGKTLNEPYPFIVISTFPELPVADLFLDTTKVVIRLEKLSYDAYLFYTSHAAYLETWNDDYAEPTLIYNNIDNGLGLFGGINKMEALFDVD